MKLKSSARITGLRSEMSVAISAITYAWRELQRTDPPVCTSCTDGRHREGSKHYVGAALDVRTKQLTDTEREKFGSTVAQCLNASEISRSASTVIWRGPEWDVLLEHISTENEHLHVEHDPKG